VKRSDPTRLFWIGCNCSGGSCGRSLLVPVDLDDEVVGVSVPFRCRAIPLRCVPLRCVCSLSLLGAGIAGPNALRVASRMR